MTPRPKAILIAGPTASGKSGLALTLAERLGGAVINADSMQVYREIPILSAQPSAEDQARVPHRLYGHVAGREPYSAGRFVTDAQAEIAWAAGEGRLPVLVGGTGLYFKALLEGLSPIPQVPDEIRAHWRAEAQRLGAAALHAVLQARDPLMAGRLKASDPQRVTRALEVLEATGQSLATWQSLPGEPVLEFRDVLALALDPEPEDLNNRIGRRLDLMMEAGALEEVRALQALGLDPSLPVMRALGVPPLSGAVRGESTLEVAVEAAKADTRQYAKRQRTWVRGNMRAWKRVVSQQMESIADEIVAFICR